MGLFRLLDRNLVVFVKRGRSCPLFQFPENYGRYSGFFINRNHELLLEGEYLVMPSQNGVDIDDTTTWIKYSKKLCAKCLGVCCSLPVEVRAEDLIRMGLMDEFELQQDLKYVARRLKKEQLVEHYHSKTEIFTLTRMAGGDCLYLDNRSRRCTIYEKRPDTCRNHPQIGPRPGYCAFKPKK